MSRAPRSAPLRRWAPLAVAAAGATAIVLPVSAPAAVVGVDKAITVTANTSDVLLAGFADGAAVSVVRDGVKIAAGVNKNDPAAAPPEGGVNSAHVGAVSGCWTTFTPQLLPGDVIQVGTDSTVVQGVTAEGVVFSGDQMIVRGTASTAHGVRLPADEIDAQLVAPGGRFSGGSAGGQFLSAQHGDLGGIITYDAPGSSHWTARWPMPASASDRAFAGASSVLGLWTGPAAGPANAGGEQTTFEAGATPGPIASCDTATYAPDAVTGADRSAVNAANQASALVLKGVAQPGVSAVTVTIADAADTAIARSATVSGRAWTATFPAADVASLVDGALSITARFKIAAGTFHGSDLSLAKDTVAPAAPTAGVAAGSYRAPQSVTLAGESGATVRYTTDGSDPKADSAVAGGPVRVATSQTLKAIAMDAAGNASPVAAYGYTIVAPSPTAASLAAALRVEALRVTRHIGLRSAHRHGITVLVTAPRGAKVVRVRLLRGKRVVAQVLRHVTGNRLLTVVLPRTRKGRRHLRRGVYRVTVAPGLDARALGVTTSRSVRVR